nr:hypothetical protein FFPRI1PSEUD_24250 [Pseudomonas sp. FFPRI_1]
MKTLIDSSIRFSVITDDSTIHISALSTDAPTQMLVARPNELYVLVEQQQSLDDLLLAERAGDDLLLSFNTQEPATPAVVLEQFFSQNSHLHLLRADGQFLRAVDAQQPIAQGPVTFTSQSLGAVAAQVEHPELSLLLAISHPDQDLKALSIAAVTAATEARAEAMQMFIASDESSVQPTTFASANSMEIPTILNAVDSVGNATGNLSSGSFTDDPNPRLVGTGTPNSTLILFDNGEPVEEIHVGSDGRWSFTPEGMIQGGHVFWVQAGEGSGALLSPPFTLVLDGTAPPQAQLAPPRAGSATGEVIEESGFTNSNRPFFSGQAEPQSSVLIYFNGEALFSVQANSQGNWSFSTSLFNLADGEYSFSVAAVDAVGNIGPRSATYPFTIDTHPPAAPLIEQVEDNVGALQGPLASGDVTDDTQPVFSGSAEAHSQVFIYDNAQLIGQTTADASGKWAFTPEKALDSGLHQITVTAVDRAGNASPEATFSFTVQTSLDAPVITDVIDDVGSVTGSIASGDTSDDTRPTLNGTVAAGTTKVNIYDGQTLLGSATLTGTSWNFTVPADKALADGPHNLRVVASDAAGNTSPDASFSFTVKTSIAAPVITGVIDDVGSVTGQIINGGTSDDTQPTLNGTVAAGTTKVNIYDGQTLLGSATLTGTSWNFTVPANKALADGPHNLRVVASDAAGNTSPDASFSFTVKTSIAAPVITGVIDDVGSVTGSIASGDTSDDTRPTLNGTVAAGTTKVDIYDGQTLLGSATLTGTSWNFTVPANKALADGPHNLRVVATDSAGNTSPDASFSFTVKTSLAAPVIIGVIDDVGSVTGQIPDKGITDDSTPTLSGTVSAGSTVRVYNGQTLLGNAIVSGTTWSFTPLTALADALYDLRVIATDAAGNTSPAATFRLTVSTRLTIDSAYDDQQPVIGTIVNGGFTNDTQPTISGHASASVNVNIRYGSQSYTVTTGTDGVWTFTPPSPLANGTHTFTASVSGTGLQSNSFSLTVDTIAPGPAHFNVYDAWGTAIGSSRQPKKWYVQSDSNMKLDGYTEPGAAITIFVTNITDGKTWTQWTGVADANGYWHTLGGQAGGLSVGYYWLYVKAVDKAGNVSATYATDDYIVGNPSWPRPRSAAVFAAEEQTSESSDHAAYALTDSPSHTSTANATTPSLAIDEQPLFGRVVDDANDVNDTHDTSFEQTDGDQGADVLLLDAKDMSVDLDELIGRITGIEKIDLGKDSSNSISLSAQSLESLTVENLLPTDGKQQFVIQGDASSTLQLKEGPAGNWTDGGETNIDGVIYHAYLSGSTELLVEQNVQVNIL